MPSDGEQQNGSTSDRDLYSGLTVAVLACIGIALAVGLSLDAKDRHAFGLEAAKAALTLATGLIIGGVLKLVLDRHTDRTQMQQQAARRFDRLLDDMRDIHDSLETTRLLIAAHRSAKTYGERLRGVVDAHVILLKMAREPGMGVCVPKRQDATALADMLGYLRALQMEYRVKYKGVSDRQRFDEEVTKQRFAFVAASWIDQAQDDPPPASREAWERLNTAATFPVLDDLCARGPEYRTFFLEPFHGLVTRMLDERAGGLQLYPVTTALDWPNDQQLLRMIEDAQRDVESHCVEAA